MTGYGPIGTWTSRTVMLPTPLEFSVTVPMVVLPEVNVTVPLGTSVDSKGVTLAESVRELPCETVSPEEPIKTDA